MKSKKVSKINAKDLPVADNVCAQVLREVVQTLAWSMAHVIMNPFAESLLHSHKKMTEIYVITKGYGELIVGLPDPIGKRCEVFAGSVHEIPSGIPHMLRNVSGGRLEHLVFALPPFDPSDVYLIKDDGWSTSKKPFAFEHLPEVQECFDGAKILSYSLPYLNLSIAFGCVINDPARRKQPHYHEKITEFIYVVEGKGSIGNDKTHRPIRSGDWIRVNPRTEHSMRNESPEDMVVVCVCSPAFQMDDVLYW